MQFRSRLSIGLVILLLGVFTSVVYAATITIDGDPSDWPGTSTCTIGTSGCPRVANDLDEASIPNQSDIENVYLTNNSTTLFIRFDTYSNTSYATGVSGTPLALVCLDTDNSTATGATLSQCANMSGVDYAIRINGNNNDPTITFFDCTSGSCGTGSATTLVEFQNTVTELSILLSDIGINSTTCNPQPCTMRMNVFFDNQDTPPDDNVPDSGTVNVQVGGGSPTAITLNNLNSTSPQGALPVVLVLIVGLFAVTTAIVLLVGTSVVIARRKH
jgi:hypothetical protein